MKRGHDFLMDSPERFDDPILNKRCRILPPPSPGLLAPINGTQHGLPHISPRRCIAQNSPFQHVENAEELDIERYVPMAKRRRMRQAADDMQMASSLSCSDATIPRHVPGSAAKHTPPEYLFTLDQVRSIVEKALQEKEVDISQQYDMILAEKLSEQFSLFSRFNQDYIHRQMEQSSFSYMS